jgi:hypothetical protein
LYTQHESSEAINLDYDGDNKVAPKVTLGQLLATAPQLLDACEGAVELLAQTRRSSPTFNKAIELLNRAIKEARS